MGKVNIFTIATATHILQIEEAKRRFACEDDDNYLIVFGNYKDSYQQLRNGVDCSAWKKVIFFYSPLYYLFDERGIPKRYTRIYKKWLYIFAYGRLMRKVKKWGKAQYFFTVNILANDVYMRRLMNEADFKRMVLFDDGTSTIHLVGHINSLYHQGVDPIVLNEVRLPKGITFFSNYRVQLERSEDDLVINQFDVQREKVVNPGGFGKKVYFLGAPLGRIYMEPDIYLGLLEKIRKHFGDQDVYYIPHRTENKTEISKIEKIFKILTIDAPVEKMLMDHTIERPGVLASCFSSGLANVASIFASEDDFRVQAFYIKQEYLKVHHKRIEGIYKSFEMLDGEKIEVVKAYDQLTEQL